MTLFMREGRLGATSQQIHLKVACELTLRKEVIEYGDDTSLPTSRRNE